MKNAKILIAAFLMLFVMSDAAGAATDTTPPAISITCPTPGTYSSQTISVSGTASDNSGVSKVEVKAGTGAWRAATGTTSWSISGIALASGANTVTAKVSDAAGNAKETSITVTYNPSAVAKPGVGNWGYGAYGTKVNPNPPPARTSSLDFQNDPRLTWDEIVSVEIPRPGVTAILQRPIYDKYGPTMNFTFIQKRFDLATANKDKAWQYGTVLLLEELFHPSVRAQWFPSVEGLATWPIDNTATFAGVQIMQIKPWYIQKYGSWDQAWWDGVKASNKYSDSKVMAWSAYFGRQLLEAWNNHMHNLGKKSALVGLIGIPPSTYPGSDMVNFKNWYAPSPMWEYITKDYDAIFTYQYPSNSAQVSRSLDEVKQLRETYGYKGKLIHVLTSVWPDGVGSDNETVQWEEFKAVAPYVDAIIGMPYTNVKTNSPNYLKEPYPPKLIKFWNQYGGSAGNPAPSCTAPVIEPTCTDGVKNGAETGIDCGGPCAACSSNPPPSSTSLTLKPQWNQISSPIAAGIDISTIESSCTILPYKTYKLWAWNATSQVWINPAKVEPFKGYWIYAAYQCNVPLSGTPAAFTSLPLSVGWNKISAAGTFSAIQGTCATHITGNWVWNWDKATERWIHPTTMELNKGYWIKVDQNCVLGG